MKTTKKRIQNNEKADSYDIDYDLFNTEEVVKIINFYHNVDKYLKHKLSKEKLQASYLEYRQTLNSIALEKKYNKAFFTKTNISIYHLMKDL